MRKLVLAIACLLAFTAQAQQPVPEFKNKVMFLAAGNTLEPLEMTALSQGMKSGLGSGQIFMKAEGRESSVPVDPASGKFIVKIDTDTDPEMVIRLYRFETDKKMRKIPMGSVGMGGMKNADIPTVALIFHKEQDGVYTISTRGPLSRGEYFFTVNQTMSGGMTGPEIQGFSFSVK